MPATHEATGIKWLQVTNCTDVLKFGKIQDALKAFTGLPVTFLKTLIRRTKDTVFFLNFCTYGKDVSTSQLKLRRNRKHKEINWFVQTK